MQLLPRLVRGSTAMLLCAATAAGAPQRTPDPVTAPPAGGPLPLALFSAEPRVGQAPLTVRFRDLSVGPVTSWRWTFGDGTSSRQRNPTHTYTEGGVYPVSLTVAGPLGEQRVRHPMGVVVRSCTPDSARANRPFPLERGEDFVPITGDDALGFYCVYSGKAANADGSGISNNVALFILPLENGEVLLFGSGYGDRNAQVVPTENARYDVQRVDALIRFCLRRDPETTPIRFVSAHGHIDHVNSDVMRELRRRGYRILEIVYHAADAAAVRNLPGWTPEDRALFRPVRGRSGQCQEELLNYASPLGKIWFYLREGHTPGSIDLAIDVRGDAANRFLVRGSGGAFGTCPIPGVREAIDPHGNVELRAVPPRLEALSPANASALGGTEVLLSGSGFAAPGAGLPEVFFGGAPAALVRVLDDSSLTCLAPPGIPGSSAEVEVLTRNGLGRYGGPFAYRAFPVLLALSPARGPTTGGTPVTLHGSGFLADGGPSTVRFGGVPATGVQVLDDATLVCTLPPGPAGTVEVSLSNPNGSAELDAAFRYEPAIDVTGVAPARGTPLGGTRVAIQGTAFGSGASVPAVTFGSAPALDVVRVSDTLLECLTPAGSPGAKVVVRVAGENGADSLADGFHYYFSPEVGAVGPASGPQAGGNEVTITGLRFTRNAAGTNTVGFGGAPATGVQVDSDTVLRCRVPPGAPGTSVDVRVSNANGSDVLVDGYRYHRAPSLASLQPGTGPRAGGTRVTLRGAGFLVDASGPTEVRFGGRQALEVRVVDDSTLTCRTRATAAEGPVDVEVANANGTARLAAAFRFVTLPHLLSIEPDHGPSRPGTLLTLRGSGFLASGAGLPAIELGGHLAADVTVLSDGTLTCRSPLARPGERVDVRVLNANGADTLPDAFRFLPLPEIRALYPDSGPEAGGTRVTVEGAGFLAAGLPRLRFGAAPALAVAVLDDGRLECTTPASSAGAVTLHLATEAGATARVEAFVFGSTAPEIQGLEPDHGASMGGTEVLVHGSGFLASRAGTNAVFFGPLPATGVVAQSDGLLRCIAPGGAPGTRVDVRVVNAHGVAQLAGGFRYRLQPTLAAVGPEAGSSLGGETVTLSGSGFLRDDARRPVVRFGGALASALSIQDDATLSCSIPPGPAGARVDVEFSCSNGRAVLPAAFRYRSAPVLTGVSPGSGSPLGGTPVTLAGAGFSDGGTPAVFFGSLPAMDVRLVDASTVSCRAPAGTGGLAVDVRLENGDGAASLPGAFAYFSAPLLQSLSPVNGPAAGGRTVVLSGRGFVRDVVGANAVTFGSTPASSVVALDDTRVRAGVPAGPAGASVDVRLSNSNGEALLAAGFRYNALPRIDAFDPPGTSARGGTAITLRGSGFQRDAAGTNQVLFGSAPGISVERLDDATLRCIAPAGTSGTEVLLRVTNANGTTLSTTPFRYFAAPTLSAVLPPYGFSGGGTLVELQGSGYLVDAAGPIQVLFGFDPATDVAVLDDARLSCRAPAGSAGPVAVVVENDNGSATVADAYFYDWAPTLIAIDPSEGSALGGTEVSLTGGGFATAGAGPLTVRFGATPAANVRVLDGGTILCTAPAGAAASRVQVTVSSSRGSSSLDGFAYHPRPVLTGVDPGQGPPAGGTLVTLRGSGFQANAAGATRVVFGSAEATGVRVLDDAAVECVTPAGPTRTRATVTLENANGAHSIVDGFQWLERHPADLNDDGIPDAVLAGADSVYLVLGSPLGLGNETTAAADLVLRASVAGGDFGARLASGDLNGDQVPDLAVAAPLDDAGGADAGAVFVFYGPLQPSPTPRLSSSASAAFRGGAAAARFGSALSIGDVSGDGQPDLLVGAPQNSNRGAVFVYRGGPAFAPLPASLASVRLTPTLDQSAFGEGLAVGDVSGDGQADVVIGAPREGASGGDSGAAYVFAGGPALAHASSDQALVQLSGAGSGDRFGSRAGVGDFDGDGVGDLFVSAAEARVGGNRTGAVHAFRGGAGLSSRSAAAASATWSGEFQDDRFGQSLALGDVDADGRADLLAGSPLADVPAANAGRAYLVRGGSFLGGAVSARAHTVFVAEGSTGDQFGAALALVDLDGDGRDDVLVGAPLSNGGATDSGRAYAFSGAALQASRFASADEWTLTGASAALNFGRTANGPR